MSWTGRALAWFVWPALVLVAATPALAQSAESSISERYDEGVHIVRPGENLHIITVKYLGDRSLWRENWKLNPEIEDPDRLKPGQRIRVLVERQRAVPTARLRTVSGRVEGKPAPIPWNPSREQDLMLEEDGLRTGGRSSTEMEFQDGTRVLLTEDSQVYLRRQGRRLTGVPPRSVEIVQGQAEVAARQPPGSESAVEIVVGGTRAVSRPDESGVAQTRARRAEDDAAKVMVYEGGGEVESGGQKVAVARGMGTSVEKGRAPGPPEKLLPAAAELSPEPGTRLDFNNVEFSWQPVAGAASYTFELCRDAECAQLVERHLGLPGPQWKPPPMTPGEYHWRVTAVSASGLDGYPTAGAELAVFGGPDRLAPSGRLVVSGPQIGRAGRLIVDETVELEPELEDAQSGVAGWRPVIDGGEASLARWRGPWPDGSYEATVVAVDRVGNEGRLPPLELTVDARPPELVVEGWRASAAGPAREAVDRCGWLRRSSWRWPSVTECYWLRGAQRRWRRQGWNWLEVSVDGRYWRPLIAASSPVAAAVAEARRQLPAAATWVAVRAERPQLLVRAADGEPIHLPDGSAAPALRVRAVDATVGVELIELGLVGNQETRLEVSAEDAFGHRVTSSWAARP